jgi:hypothetical protein
MATVEELRDKIALIMLADDDTVFESDILDQLISAAEARGVEKGRAEGAEQERERQKENEMLDRNGERMLVEEYTGQTPRRIMKVRYHYGNLLGNIGAFVDFVYRPVRVPDNVKLDRTYVGWLYAEYPPPASVLAPKESEK